MSKLEIQKAEIRDIIKTRAMINQESMDNGTIKTRSLKELYGRIQSLYVVRDHGKVIASGRLVVYSDNLSEVNCFVVSPEYRLRGIGRKLLKKIIAEAKSYNVSRLIALASSKEFLKKSGFVECKKEEISQKINNDCVNCDRYPDKCKADFFIKYLS